jgi:endoglucanase
MKQMIAICKRFGAACVLGALVVGGLVGVAVAQGLWHLGPPQPQVQNRAYFPVKQCINMGSGLEAPREGEWGYTFRQRDLASVKAADFDTVRIPIKWSAHALPNAPYTISPQFFARIDQIMTWALEQDLNVIINVHHYEELYQDPDRHEPRLLGMWSQIAARYRTAPANVMFEIINEPRDAFSGERVNRIQAQALSIIRATNPTRTVILTGDAWGSIEGMDNLKLPPDPFVVGTVHYYGPYEFTHQLASWLPNPPPARTWPKTGDKEQLARDIRRMAAFRDRIQAPVLMGEYGVGNEVSMVLRAAWTADVTRAFNEINMPTCYFNYASGFAAYDLQSERWHRPLLDALGLPRTNGGR